MAIRVLHITASLGGGGVAKVLVNYFEHFDPQEIIFDFVVHGEEIGVNEKYFSQTGSRIYHAPPKRSAPFKNYEFISKIIRDGNYDIIHAHQNLSNVVSLGLAKYHRVPVRISHGHGYSTVRRPIASLAKRGIEIFATDYFACTTDVGKWLHPKKWNAQGERTFIMQNAFDLSRFFFNADARNEWRRRLDLGSMPTMIQVGRLSPEKNHSFTLRLLQGLRSRAPWKLLIVGDGPLEPALRKQANDLGLSEEITFMGYQNDISGILSAADLAVMPSLSEGLGLAAVEAQVAGLPVMVSDGVPEEARVTDSIYRAPLNLPTWLETIGSESLSESRPRSFQDERLAAYAIGPAAALYLSYLQRALARSRSQGL